MKVVIITNWPIEMPEKRRTPALFSYLRKREENWLAVHPLGFSNERITDTRLDFTMLSKLKLIQARPVLLHKGKRSLHKLSVTYRVTKLKFFFQLKDKFQDIDLFFQGSVIKIIFFET